MKTENEEELIKEAFGIDFLEWYCQVFIHDPELKEKIRLSQQKPLAYRELLKFLQPFAKKMKEWKMRFGEIRYYKGKYKVRVKLKSKGNWMVEVLEPIPLKPRHPQDRKCLRAGDVIVTVPRLLWKQRRCSNGL